MLLINIFKKKLNKLEIYKKERDENKYLKFYLASYFYFKKYIHNFKHIYYYKIKIFIVGFNQKKIN